MGNHRGIQARIGVALPRLGGPEGDRDRRGRIRFAARDDGAKFALNGQYPKNGLSIAADAFATSQLAAFLFGKFSDPNEKVGVANFTALKGMKLELNTLYVTQDDGEVYETFQTPTGVAFAKLTR